MDYFDRAGRVSLAVLGKDCAFLAPSLSRYAKIRIERLVRYSY
jgi:hypothetical protein